MTSWGALGLASSRTRRRLALLWSALFVLSILLQYAAFVMAPAALAVHDEGLFELDGNAVSESGVAGDDWDKVKAGTSSAFSTKFDHDLVDSQNDDTFKGSTGDDQPISDWRWVTAKASQAKNDIADAFAAAYTAKNGHTIAYFGLDKWEADGDNFVGFWFFKNAVAPAGDGSTSAGDPFSGSHAVGDILVLADYTNGGAVSTFNVYKWVGTGGDVAPAHTLDTVASGVPCTVAPGDIACGATNGSTETAPWAFDGRDGAPREFPAGTFFEGGIDLTALGLDVGCFTSFQGETRSSQQVTATLSDFAGGRFSFCVPPSIATQVEQDGQSLGSLGSISLGESVEDTATLTGSRGTVNGSVAFFLCGPSSAAPDCSSGGTNVGSKTLSGGTATSASVTPTAAGTYCFRVQFTPAAGSKYLAASHTNKTTECFTVLSPDVAVTKVAPNPVVHVGQTATFNITVTNVGTAVAHGVVLTDPLPAGPNWQTATAGCSISAGTLTCNIGDLAPKATFTATVSANTDTSAPNTEDCHVLDNTATVSATNEPDSALDNNQSSASITVTCVSALTIQKSVTGNTAGTDPDLHVPAAKIGDTLTYTLTYSGAGPLNHVVITDDLPDGLAFIQGSACKVASDPLPCDTTNPDVQFAGIIGGLLTWQADSLPDPAHGSVTFKVRVLAGAADVAQPIVNTATIDSDETQPDSDTAAIAVLPAPEALTPPPTNTLSATPVASNPGFALMLILLGVAGVIAIVGLVTPAPGTRRRSRRR